MAEAAAAPPPPSAAKLAWLTYRGLLEGTVAGYSTSAAQDREALGLGAIAGAGGGGEAPESEGATMPPRTRLALEFRLSQKALLNQALAANAAAGASGMAESAARIRFQVLGARAYEAALAEEDAHVTPSGLIISHLVEGSGAAPSAKDTVTVHYEGKNADGIVFDSSYKRGEPLSFAVTGVIAGWTEGLQLMRVGGKAQLTIPSHLGYGDKGNPPNIPAKATLLFTVELLGIK